MMTTNRSRRLHTAWCIACCAALGACSIFDRPAPSTNQFMLTTAAPAALGGEPLGSVVVRRAGTVKPYDERGFVYQLANGQWRIDAYNGFLADPADMVTDALVRGLEGSGRFGLVLESGVASATDFTVESAIEAFYTDFRDRSRPEAVVQMRLYLLERSTGKGSVVHQCRARVTEPLRDGSPGSVADALSAATARAISELAGQLPASRSGLAGAAGAP